MGQPNLQNWDELERQIWGGFENENEYDFQLDPSSFDQEEISGEKKGPYYSAYVEKVELAIDQVNRLQKEEHSLTKKRRKQAAHVIFAIILIVGMFYIALGESAKVSALNNENSDIKKNISKLQLETSQAKELLLNSVDEQQVRWFAIENFGMQYPGRNQIVDAKMPESDQLIQRGADTNGEYALSSKNIDWAKENLATYFAGSQTEN